MTFEKGNLSTFSSRFRQMSLAQSTALSAASANSRSLLSSWAAGWREARAQGARGVLSPNRLVSGRPASRKVADRRVFAYAIRADRNAGDVARLVERLRSFGVDVTRLSAPATVALRPWAAASASPTTLPAGTYWVSMAQGPKHWIETLLGDDSYVPVRYFSDVTAWSNPLLMGLDGGAVETRSPPGGLVPAGAPQLGVSPDAPAAAYAFPVDSTGALTLLGKLLRDGVAVRRDASRAIVPGSADLTRLRADAARLQVPVTALSDDPGSGAALSAPRVALLVENDSSDFGGATSLGWTRWVLEKRLELPVSEVTPAKLDAGALAGADVLVVPGASVSSPLSATALAQIKLLVTRGGAYVGIRDRGVDIARAAGLTRATTSRPGALMVPGTAIQTAVDTGDPVGWGLAPQGFAFDDSDPVLSAPAGARVAVRYPASPKLSGYAEGIGALGGTPAVLVDGGATLFSFDPSYRGYAEWGQRLLANAVLAPRGGGSARARALRDLGGRFRGHLRRVALRCGHA